MSTEKDFSPQQSFDVITTMINQAQGKMRKNSFYFLLWGWTIMLANLGMYGLTKFTQYPHPYAVWIITVPAWIISMIYGSRQDKKAAISTHLDKINMWLWIGFGLSIAPVVFFMKEINFNINPIILIMTAVPTFITGIMLRFKPLLYGGINFWVFGILCFLVGSQTQHLLGGVAILFGYLIPGYMLKNTHER